MKKVIFLTILLLAGIVYSFGEALSFSLSNREIKVISEDRGVRATQTDSYYSGNKDDPSIPILAHYFEIPEFTKIESVNIKAVYSTKIPLDNPLLKQPEQVILSQVENVNTKSEVYDGDKLPQSWLFNSGSSISGSKNIAYIAVYACGYDREMNSLQVPKDFLVEVNLVNSPKAKKMPDSRITRETHQQLNLPFTREYEQETYLLIYPQDFANAYQPLIEFRKSQGLNVITATTETIFAEYLGADNAEKIRNFIIEKYNDNGVDYVTLGADTNYIQERRLWAFDCNFGIDDENNIPGDIYYANLNGDWNANQNELYGEDADDVDQFPEVIVARIPIMSYNTDSVASAIINKLIAYESGHYPDYSQGLGLSQNLWEDSNSVYVQEYIEEMFYPDFINNIILNEAENSVANAQENFNRNPNIIQHTGHCFWNVIALGNGTINPTFINNMTNDYAGVMYSIGCWAVSMEFNAIAEQLLRVAEHGISAFVGNSRYGWGAPTADGFGFSEFYQKEFSKLLFQEDITNIAIANQLQKLPFIAYQNETSVYKWCSYQLNTLGDSYYHLFTEEPKDFVVDYRAVGDNYTLFVSDGQAPLEDVDITIAEDNYSVTDTNGIATFIAEANSLIKLYKSGYKIQELLLEPSYESSIVEYQLPEIVAPNSERVIDFKVFNGLDIDLSWEVRVKEANELLGQVSGNLIANATSDWLQVSFTQPETNILSLELYSNTTSEIVDTKHINVELAKPIIEITNFSVNQYPLSLNESNSFSYTIMNTSNYVINQLFVEYNSGEIEFPVTTNQRLSLDIGEELTITGEEFALMSEVDFASLQLNFTLNNDYWQEITQEFTYYFSVADESLYETFEESPTWLQESAWQRTDFYAYEGDYSLTCEPTEYGVYDLDLPLLTYTDDLTLSFMYKYKMPMYGEDGFSIYVIDDDIQERIIFLGSGGALNGGQRDPEDLIFSDWEEYSLNLGELLLNKPEIGSEFTIRFSFNYIQDFNVNNDYVNVDELGVFLDNMQLSHSGQVVSNDENAVSAINSISLYPNPLRGSNLSIKHNSKIGDKYVISVYNLKGQKISSYKSIIKSSDSKSIQLPIFQKNRDSLTSGIYFVTYKTVDTSVTKKILFLK